MKKAKNEDDIIRAIIHMNATKEVLDEAIDRINALKSPLYDEHVAVLNIIAKINISTPDLLIKAINSTNSINAIILAINNINANEYVCIKAMDRIDKLAESYLPEHVYVLEAIINSIKVTPTLLIDAINRTDSSLIIREAVNSPVANELVLNKAVDKAFKMAGDKEALKRL